MTRVRRLIPLLPLVCFLAGWGASYFWSPLVVVRGYGAAVDRGSVMFAGPQMTGAETVVRLDRVVRGQPRVERAFDDRVQPWKPVRRLDVGGAGLWLVEAWLVAVLLAVPTVWAVRRQRGVESPRGFEVMRGEGGEAHGH